MRKILLLILSAVLLTATFYVTALAEQSPYEQISFLDASEYSQGVNISPDGYIGGIASGTYIKFSGLDFGDEGAKAVVLDYAVPSEYSGELALYVDGRDSSNLVSIIEQNPTATWTSFEKNETVFSEDKFIYGVHDIYIVCTKHPGANLKSIQFKKEYLGVYDPTVTLLDKFGRPTTRLNIAVSGSCVGSIYHDLGYQRNVKMNVCYFDSFNKFLGEQSVYEKDIDGKVTEFKIDELSIPKGASYLLSYYIDDDNNVMGKPFYMGASQPYTPKVNDNEIYGYEEQYDVIVGTNKKSNNYVRLILKDKVSNEVCGFSVLKTDENGAAMRILSGGLASGQYVAILENGNFSKETEFSYVSYSDAYAALSSLYSATDTKEFEEALLTGASALEINTSGIENIADKEFLCQTLKKEFTLAIGAVDYNDKATHLSLCKSLGEIIDKYLILEKLYAYKSPSLYCDVIDSVFIGDTQNRYYKFYTDKSNKEKSCETVIKNITDRFENMDKFKFFFGKMMVISSFDQAVLWGDIDTALIDNEIELSLDLAIYKNLTNDKKISVCIPMLGIIYESYSDITDALKKFLNDVLNPSVPVPPTTGGGGSTGGSSTSVKKPAPVVDTTKTTEISVKDESIKPYEEPELPKVSFIDLDEFEWAKKEIVYLTQNGYIQGKSDKIFDPSANITREEFAKIVSKAFSLYDENAQCNFKDVDTQTWYYPYVASLYKAGVMNGYEDNTFGIGENITRQQIASIIYRCTMKKGMIIKVDDKKAAFVDSDNISDYAYSAVCILSQANIISGVGNNMFAPNDYATRAQATVIIYRLLTLN